MLRAVALPFLLAAPAAAQEVECRLALALAMDVSSSVDAGEDALQRGGLAAALVAPEVERAFLGSGLPVALAIYEWSGRRNHQLLLDWMLIRNPGDLRIAAEAVAGSSRSTDAFPTALGYALGYGAGLLEDAPPCLFRTLDVAGDGINNDGFPPASAYRAFPFEGVTVNGLVIQSGGSGGDREVSARVYYAEEVLRGPLAFLELADGFEDYEHAMRRKLEREVSSRAIGLAVTGR